jgi:hypothetical protein
MHLPAFLLPDPGVFWADDAIFFWFFSRAAAIYFMRFYVQNVNFSSWGGYRYEVNYSQFLFMVITYVNNVLIFDVCVEGNALESRSPSIVETSTTLQIGTKITNFLETKVKSQKTSIRLEGPFYVRTVSTVLIKLSDSEK